MSCGKPVIASDVDGLKQVVEGAGEIFHKGDIIGLAGSINSLLLDKYKYERVSSFCLKRAMRYDIDFMVDKYLEIYNVL